MKRMRIKLSTPEEVRRAISRIANMTLNGELDAKTANSIIMACNAILGAIRTDDQQRRIDELERLITEQK